MCTKKKDFSLDASNLTLAPTPPRGTYDNILLHAIQYSQSSPLRSECSSFIPINRNRQ